MRSLEQIWGFCSGADSGISLSGADSGIALSGADTGIVLSGADTGIALSGADSGIALSEPDSEIALSGTDSGFFFSQFCNAYICHMLMATLSCLQWELGIVFLLQYFFVINNKMLQKTLACNCLH